MGPASSSFKGAAWSHGQWIEISDCWAPGTASGRSRKRPPAPHPLKTNSHKPSRLLLLKCGRQKTRRRSLQLPDRTSCVPQSSRHSTAFSRETREPGAMGCCFNCEKTTQNTVFCPGDHARRRQVIKHVLRQIRLPPRRDAVRARTLGAGPGLEGRGVRTLRRGRGRVPPGLSRRGPGVLSREFLGVWGLPEPRTGQTPGAVCCVRSHTPGSRCGGSPSGWVSRSPPAGQGQAPLLRAFSPEGGRDFCSLSTDVLLLLAFHLSAGSPGFPFSPEGIKESL